jgi:gas vesicle protein
MYEDNDSSWSFAIGLFVGAAAGAALASLFTPRSGAQNREIVRERGLVLKDRVSDRATTVSTSVKDSTSSRVSSVKDSTNSAVASVRETATSAVSTVKDATNSAVAKVSETVSTVKESVSSAAEKVSETASTVVEKVSETASTAADKARSMTGGTQEIEVPFTPTTAAVVSEARYDAEDVRPATASAEAAQPAPEALDTLASIDTFEPTMPAIAPASDAQIDLVTPADVLTEVRSDEQFEVADMTTEPLNERTADQSAASSGSSGVREASEAAERGDRPTNV